MAFWSGEKILSRCPELISDFNPDQIDCNAYALRMGNEFFHTPDHDGDKREYAHKTNLAPGQSFLIPPGQFGFLSVKESIKIPKDSMAFISMKATYKFRGLINVSGFHVDPGFEGRLIFSVYNAGSGPLYLEEGMRLFLLWYADLDRESKYAKQGESGKTISNDLLQLMSGEILSPQALSQELTDIRNKMTVQVRVFAFGVAFVASIAVGIVVLLIRSLVVPDAPPAAPNITINVPKDTLSGSTAVALPLAKAPQVKAPAPAEQSTVTNGQPASPP